MHCRSRIVATRRARLDRRHGFVRVTRACIGDVFDAFVTRSAFAHSFMTNALLTFYAKVTRGRIKTTTMVVIPHQEDDCHGNKSMGHRSRFGRAFVWLQLGANDG
jgi:hypothetical protein